MINHALALTQRGMRVFPLRHNDKRPLIKDWQSRATNDHATIEELWRQNPQANIGVATGNGIMVIDIDVKHGDGFLSLAQCEAKLGPLPATLTVGTTTGGEHRYFSLPQGIDLRNTHDKLAPYIDTRGSGGYVAAPGSAIEGKPYTITRDLALAELPRPWIDALRGAKKAYGKTALMLESAAVAMAKPGSRNCTLNNAALKLGSLAAGGEVDATVVHDELLLAARACDLPDAEARATIRSGMTAGARTPRQAPPRQPTTIGINGDDDWMQSLRTTEDGIAKEPGNAALILAHDPEWKETIAHDDLTDGIIWAKAPPIIVGMARPKAGEDFKDSDVTYIRHWLSKYRKLSLSHETIQQAVPTAALCYRVNTMRQYYEGLVWDERPRVDWWLSTYLGVKGNQYSSAVGKWWLVSVVARALRPGCQVDHMLVLEGPQGSGKSRAIRILGGQWTLGSLPDIRDKDAMQAIHGKGVIEVAELDAIKGAAWTRIKNFLTQQTDSYRPSYGRYQVVRKRTCVFVGTTNEIGYLSDATGARRFWPVTCGTIDLPALQRDRDQLFAEARHLYAQGGEWWPTDSMLQVMICAEQEVRASHDAWEDLISPWMLTQMHPVTTTEIGSRCLDLEPSRCDRAAQTRIGAIMRRLGYASTRQTLSSGARIRVYWPTSNQGGQQVGL